MLGMKSQVRNQYVTCSPSSSPGLWRRQRRSNLFDLSRLSSHRCLLATCTHLPQLPHPPHHVFTSGSSSGCVSSVMEHVGWWWWWWFSHDSCGKLGALIVSAAHPSCCHAHCPQVAHKRGPGPVSQHLLTLCGLLQASSRQHVTLVT